LTVLLHLGNLIVGLKSTWTQATVMRN
jgi:hypothetical protein